MDEYITLFKIGEIKLCAFPEIIKIEEDEFLPMSVEITESAEGNCYKVIFPYDITKDTHFSNKMTIYTYSEATKKIEQTIEANIISRYRKMNIYSDRDVIEVVLC